MKDRYDKQFAEIIEDYFKQRALLQKKNLGLAASKKFAAYGRIINDLKELSHLQKLARQVYEAIEARGALQKPGPIPEIDELILKLIQEMAETKQTSVPVPTPTPTPTATAPGQPLPVQAQTVSPPSQTQTSAAIRFTQGQTPSQQQWDEKSAFVYLVDQCIRDEKMVNFYRSFYNKFYSVIHSNHPQFPSTSRLETQWKKETPLLHGTLSRILGRKIQADPHLEEATNFLLTRDSQNNIILGLIRELQLQADADKELSEIRKADTSATVNKKR